MSIIEWGIMLYGVNVSSLDFKDGEDGFKALAGIAEENDYEFDVCGDNHANIHLDYIEVNEGDRYLG